MNMETTSTSTDIDQTTPTLTWIRDFTSKHAAIGQAIQALANHCQQLPSLRSADDTEVLLNWRRRVFQLFTLEPCGIDVRQRSAETAAKEIQVKAFSLISAYETILHTIEAELTRAPSRGRAGLINAQAIPQGALHRDQHRYFINLDSLPPTIRWFKPSTIRTVQRTGAFTSAMLCGRCRWTAYTALIRPYGGSYRIWSASVRRAEPKGITKPK
jgi:hypothetical protein